MHILKNKKLLKSCFKSNNRNLLTKAKIGRNTEGASYKRKSSKSKFKPKFSETINNSGNIRNIQQGVETNSAFKCLKQTIKKRSMDKSRRSEIIQFRSGSSFSTGFKADTAGKMSKLLTFNCKEGDNRFRIVSKGSRKNKLLSSEEVLKSTEKEASKPNQEEKYCSINTKSKGKKVLKKSDIFDNKHLQKKEVSWANNLPTICSSEQTYDKSSKKESGSLSSTLSPSVKFSPILKNGSHETSRASGLDNHFDFINPNPHSIFEELTPLGFSNCNSDYFKPSALESRLNSVIKKTSESSVSQASMRVSVEIPPRAPLNQERLVEHPRTPLLQKELEGYNLISEYSFSKDTSRLVHPPIEKRHSLEDPCRIDHTETDIFELSDINS